ncbi:hypothetical protein MSPP1_000714 [Malassezia sp. CBS 17886]|nr:hypothetical protein MSPP1_000714 [Malassezia sp. CBS 17886]
MYEASGSTSECEFTNTYDGVEFPDDVLLPEPPDPPPLPCPVAWDADVSRSLPLPFEDGGEDVAPVPPPFHAEDEADVVPSGGAEYRCVLFLSPKKAWEDVPFAGWCQCEVERWEDEEPCTWEERWRCVDAAALRDDRLAAAAALCDDWLASELRDRSEALWACADAAEPRDDWLAAAAELRDRSEALWACADAAELCDDWLAAATELRDDWLAASLCDCFDDWTVELPFDWAFSDAALELRLRDQVASDAALELRVCGRLLRSDEVLWSVDGGSACPLVLAVCEGDASVRDQLSPQDCCGS